MMFRSVLSSLASAFFIAALIAFGGGASTTLAQDQTATTAADSATLTSEEFSARVVGNTIQTGTWQEYIGEGGETAVNSNGRRLRGAWKFDGEGVVCFAYEKVRNANGCYKTRLRGNSVEWLGPKSGNVLHRTSLTAGNRVK